MSELLGLELLRLKATLCMLGAETESSLGTTVLLTVSHLFTHGSYS